MSKHAYLLVANSNFKVLEICLKMIDDERNDIYMLFDAKSKISNEKLEGLKQSVVKSQLFILPSIVINWAGYSQIQAVLNLIKMANSRGEEYSYLHFFQGSDLPIKSQDQIHSYFEQNNGYEFVMIDTPNKKMAQNKAWYRHYFCHNRYFRKNKFIKVLNFGLVYLQKIFRIRKNKDIELYQGSALFSITGNCAKFVEEEIPQIRKRFKHSLAADEVFLQTILMASEYGLKIKNVDQSVSCNARMIDRTRPDGKNSPHVWRREEVDYLLSLPDGFCFARKFDEKIDFDTARLLFQSICKKETL